jgi:hypothetical protein
VRPPKDPATRTPTLSDLRLIQRGERAFLHENEETTMSVERQGEHPARAYGVTGGGFAEGRAEPQEFEQDGQVETAVLQRSSTSVWLQAAASCSSVHPSRGART